MDIFTWFFTPEFVVFSLIIWALVLFQRKVIEYIFTKFGKDVSKSKLWRSLLLPFGPIGTGSAIGWLVTSYPYPEIFAASLLGRIGYGIVAGLFSMQLYKFGKEWFSGKFKALKKSNSNENKVEDKDVSE